MSSSIRIVVGCPPVFVCSGSRRSDEILARTPFLTMRTPPPLLLAVSARLIIAILLASLANHDVAAAEVSATCGTAAEISAAAAASRNRRRPPNVAGRTLLAGGTVVEIDSAVDGGNLKEVLGCCSSSGGDERGGGGDASSSSSSILGPTRIGHMPQFTTGEAMAVLDATIAAWDGGMGTWPQTSLGDRILAVERFLVELGGKREDIVEVLMWEIGKNRRDAEAEFDRTIKFARECIAAIRDPTNSEFNSDWDVVGRTRAFVRRAAIGIIMVLGPFNYPLNETYATLIPALLMGNVVIMKIPTVGGLAHLLTMEAFASALPPGTVHFISGSGRTTMPPLMRTGHVDGLAFIGGSAAADDLIKDHPHPHRLKLFLQLEAKNMAIFLPDLFEDGNSDALDRAIDETVLGSLSYNGQRCTALKIVFVPARHSTEVAEKLARRVESLRIGLPWQTWGGDGDGGDTVHHADITPLPNSKRVEYMKRLISDATSKGADVVNVDGGSVVGGDDSTLMIPAVLHPVREGMDVYVEEQFGPVVPVAPYDSIGEVLRYGREGNYGQQCSVFTAGGADGAAAEIVDRFSSVFGKINVNSQCGRSPDSVPFSGRRSSALGVMSVTDALREFSVPTVVAHREDERGTNTRQVVDDIQESAKFMQSL